jgi:hypothetical protein
MQARPSREAGEGVPAFQTPITLTCTWSIAFSLHIVRLALANRSACLIKVTDSSVAFDKRNRRTGRLLYSQDSSTLNSTRWCPNDFSVNLPSAFRRYFTNLLIACSASH